MKKENKQMHNYDNWLAAATQMTIHNNKYCSYGRLQQQAAQLETIAKI